MESQNNYVNKNPACLMTVLNRNKQPLNVRNTSKLQLLGKSIDTTVAERLKNNDLEATLPDRSQSMTCPDDLPLTKIVDEDENELRCPKCFTKLSGIQNALNAHQSAASLKKGLTQTSASSSSPTTHQNSLSEQRNPFYEVSNEYMRVSGYAQQFAKFLQKNRRKRFADPTGITVSLPPQKQHSLSSAENRQSPIMARTFSLKRPTSVERHAYHPITEMVGDRNGSCIGAEIGNKALVDWTSSQTDVRTETTDETQRANLCSPYGILWKVPPNFKRIKKRKQLFVLKTRACYLSLFLALTGIALAMLDAELVANERVSKTGMVSQLLRTLIISSTFVLAVSIIMYHAIEIQIALIDSGAYDWQVTVTADRIFQLTIELLVCCISPFPNNLMIPWIVLEGDRRQVRSVQVPLNIALVPPMFLRAYLISRTMALQSRQFQDAATRSIASLNRVAVNFAFVAKTMMFEHPLRVLCSFTICFWVALAWLFMHCERVSDVPEDNGYLNALWFIMITFKSIGYGDIVPNTYCGRILAISAGIVGAAVSSALIAVISNKLELSRAEKHVNNFMADSKLTQMRKHSAAMVLQHTWFIHKYREILTTKDEMKLRFHQRRFLAAINQFRKVKWDQRKLAEQGNALIDLAKLQNDTYTMIYRMQQSIDKLTAQVTMIRKDNDTRLQKYSRKITVE